MPSINLPTKATQDAIKAVVDGINTKTATITTQTQIKETIDGINTKTAIATVQNQIKANTDTIKNNVASLINGRVVKSVQRGTVSGGTMYVSLSTVNPLKCLALATGIYRPSTLDPYTVNIASLTSNRLNFSYDTGNSHAFTVSWQVIEFY